MYLYPKTDVSERTERYIRNAFKDSKLSRYLQFHPDDIFTCEIQQSPGIASSNTFFHVLMPSQFTDTWVKTILLNHDCPLSNVSSDFLDLNSVRRGFLTKFKPEVQSYFLYYYYYDEKTKFYSLMIPEEFMFLSQTRPPLLADFTMVDKAPNTHFNQLPVFTQPFI